MLRRSPTVTRDATTRAPRSALERMQRTTYFAVGLAAALFTALLAGGPNGFIAQMDQLHAPFGAFTVLVGVAIPASYSFLAFLLSMNTMRVLVTVCAAGFIASQVFWVPAMVNDVLADGAAPWLQGFGALHATLLGVAWNRAEVWAFPLSQGPMVAIVEFHASGGNLEQSLLDGVGALVTNLILTGAGAGVVTAAARQDQEAQRAVAVATHEAALRTSEREQTRINALVHDDIMSVLLAASRTPTPGGVAEQARRALESVATISSPQPTAQEYSPQELAAALRTTARAISADVSWNARVDSTVPVPAPVVAALAEATGEALRNSVLHAGRAGEHVHRELAVAISDQEVRVTVRDNGRGFVERQVPERRLGLAVSIHGRMNALPGGGARVISAPGQGTTVDLWWRPEVAR